MKINKLRIIMGSCCTALILLVSVDTNAQTRKLPDGSIVYSDGARKLPNGTVVYGNGSTASNKKLGVFVPNESVIYKRRNAVNNGMLPPGQAKKLYGGSAKDYAPGQQKKWKGDFKENRKQGKGHKD